MEKVEERSRKIVRTKTCPSLERELEQQGQNETNFRTSHKIIILT